MDSYYFPEMNKWKWIDYPYQHDSLMGFIHLPAGKFAINATRNADDEPYKVNIYTYVEYETDGGGDEKHDKVYEVTRTYTDRKEAKEAGINALKILLTHSMEEL